jgi:hypothetical protein
MDSSRFVASYDRAADRSVTSAEGLLEAFSDGAAHDLARRVAPAARADPRGRWVRFRGGGRTAPRRATGRLGARCPYARQSWPRMPRYAMVERRVPGSTSWGSPLAPKSSPAARPSHTREIGSGKRSGTSPRALCLNEGEPVSKTEGRRFEPCRPCPLLQAKSLHLSHSLVRRSDYTERHRPSYGFSLEPRKKPRAEPGQTGRDRACHDAMDRPQASDRDCSRG